MAMFSRIESSPNMPSALRSSGQKATPLASEARGEGLSFSPAILTEPESARSAPNTSLALSVRPAPSRPLKPTASPGRKLRSNGAMTRALPSPSATRIGSPVIVSPVA